MRTIFAGPSRKVYGPIELRHYDLHVWLFKDNPAGLFKSTNPNVKCRPDEKWSHPGESNPEPPHYECGALPIELGWPFRAKSI